MSTAVYVNTILISLYGGKLQLYAYIARQYVTKTNNWANFSILYTMHKMIFTTQFHTARKLMHINSEIHLVAYWKIFETMQVLYTQNIYIHRIISNYLISIGHLLHCKLVYMETVILHKAKPCTLSITEQ